MSDALHGLGTGRWFLIERSSRTLCTLCTMGTKSRAKFRSSFHCVIFVSSLSQSSLSTRITSSSLHLPRLYFFEFTTIEKANDQSQMHTCVT